MPLPLEARRGFNNSPHSGRCRVHSHQELLWLYANVGRLLKWPPRLFEVGAAKDIRTKNSDGMTPM